MSDIFERFDDRLRETKFFIRKIYFLEDKLVYKIKFIPTDIFEKGIF